MVTYAVSRANYAELWGLSSDDKPEGIGAVPNGSLFTEIDTGKSYRFNGETGLWFDGTQKYPVSMEIDDGGSGQKSGESDPVYKVTYSDDSSASSPDISVKLDGDKAYYSENGFTVSCDAIEVTVTIVIASKTATYTGSEITLSAYDDTLTSPDVPYSAEASNSTIFNVSTDIIPKYETKTIKMTNVGEEEFGLTDADFSTDNDQCIVTFSVTDGGLEITEAEFTVAVVGTSDSVVYDGEAHTIEGYTATCDNAAYSADNIVFSGTATASGTEVGSYNMGLAANQFSYDDENCAATFSVTDGTLLITQQEPAPTPA